MNDGKTSGGGDEVAEGEEGGDRNFAEFARVRLLFPVTVRRLHRSLFCSVSDDDNDKQKKKKFILGLKCGF